MQMSSPVLESDPLLKDLTEKKLSFQRNVGLLATELKNARSKLASQEALLAHESQTRLMAETKAREMEDQVSKLQRCLQNKDEELMVACSSEMYLEELDGLRLQLSATEAIAEASASSALAVQSQCSSLLKEVEEKGALLKEHEIRVDKLAEQMDRLQMDLNARELAQQQLRDEVLRVETEIMNAIAVVGSNRDCELGRILAEVSPKNIENLNKHLNAKDEEIARLRDEIRIVSAHWKMKTQELESQLEKHRRADQELKKRVMKLEFCLQELRCQMRKLQRVEERRDRTIKDLRDQLAIRQQQDGVGCGEKKQSFWESSGFKFVVSMSMLALVVITKR